MADSFVNPEEEEVEEKVDPETLAPDLWQAVKADDSGKALELIEEGVPLTHVDEESGWNVVNWAAYNGNGRLLKVLLEKGGASAYHDFKKEQMQRKSEFVKDLEITSLVTSTPLMWAVFKGHQRCVWLLLLEGYQADDTDNMGNSCLHLAASNGHEGILQALSNNGANPFLLNTYKNTPLDVALNQRCRDILRAAMDHYHPDGSARAHTANVEYYTKKSEALSNAISQASMTESPRAFRAATGLEATISLLKATLAESIEIGLDEEQIATGQRLEKKLDRAVELMDALALAQANSPIDTQTKYEAYISKLEVSISRAEAAGLDRSHVQFARDLVVRSQIEFLIFTASKRLDGVECAKDVDERDMLRLKAFIQKGQALQANPPLIQSASSRLKRLEAELEMSRAILAVPVVKLPMEDPPEGYWGEEDTGKITETEEYPLPPPDTGEYIWEHSAAYSKLLASVNRLKRCTDGAADLGANEEIIKEATDLLVKVEKDIKLLDLKDQEDKRVAVEAATKAAKKLKKGKKGKKK